MNPKLKKLFSHVPQVKRLLSYQTVWGPGHYYSPIPDLDKALDYSQMQVDQLLPIQAIDLRDDSQLGLLHELASFMNSSLFTNTEKVSSHRFYNKNGIYGFSDALYLEAMIRHVKPAQIIEVGSGHTSALMLDIREKYFNHRLSLSFIEPYPERLFQLLSEDDKKKARLFIQPLQTVGIEIFKELNPNDILFIDSSHVGKTGSDLLYLFFEILPVLEQGVYIHFHDLFNNFEYMPWHFKTYKGFAWNEAYFLRAFLMYNPKFQVELYSQYLEIKFRNKVQSLVPSYPFGTGAQLWIRKI